MKTMVTEQTLFAAQTTENAAIVARDSGEPREQVAALFAAARQLYGLAGKPFDAERCCAWAVEMLAIAEVRR